MAAQSIDRPRKKRSKPLGKTKIKQIKSLKVAGVTERQIVALTGVPKTTTHQIIHKVFDEDELKSFKNQEPKILATKRAMILDSIDQDEINAAPLRDKAVTYGIFIEKQLLIEGKATSIIAYDPTVLRERYAELRALMAQSNQIIDITPEKHE